MTGSCNLTSKNLQKFRVNGSHHEVQSLGTNASACVIFSVVSRRFVYYYLLVILFWSPC